MAFWTWNANISAAVARSREEDNARHARNKDKLQFIKSIAARIDAIIREKGCSVEEAATIYYNENTELHDILKTDFRITTRDVAIRSVINWYNTTKNVELDER